ncbi:TonB family protein [Zoogloeaceae bacterium G21618-S1]|nr:TonB family protein [Zoogloeaceae bacterium G21618-S1]
MSALAEEEIFEAPWRRHARQIGLAVVVAALIGVVVWLVQGLGSSATAPARQVTKITILPDTPPPPPPPPPKEQPKPEPKDVPKQAKLDTPKPVDTPKPQDAAPIKMEGEAGDGPSPFAAGPVTQEYTGGEIGTGNGMQFAFYTNLLQRRIQSALQQAAALKGADFRVVVHVWLDADGRLTRSELADSTGDGALDAALRAAMVEVPAVGEAPPSGMPQPVRIRVTNRVAG